MQINIVHRTPIIKSAISCMWALVILERLDLTKLDWKIPGLWGVVGIIDYKAHELNIPKEKLAEGLTPVFHP